MLAQSNWKRVSLAALLFATAVAALPGGAAAHADEPPEGPKKVDPPAALSSAGRLVEAAKKVYVVMELEFQRGLRQPEDLYQWSRRWRDSEMAAAGERALSVAAEKAVAAGIDHRVQAAKSHLERMQKVEQFLERRVKSAMARPSELYAAQYYVAEAQRAVDAEAGPR